MMTQLRTLKCQAVIMWHMKDSVMLFPFGGWRVLGRYLVTDRGLNPSCTVTIMVSNLSQSIFTWRLICYIRTANAQIRLRICAVWSGPSLSVDTTYIIHWFCKRTAFTKTHLFKYIENFISKNWKVLDKKLWHFSYFCSKHRLWVLVRTASARRS